ncbi:MAG: glycogen debranching enzyme GlgX [Desulfobulbus sp.]|nr:MAG: glycogen debranching enzyme GlgX [Desulfobulbus sp.]
MKINITSATGCPIPLGASLTPEGINFALFSRHADAVSLVLEVNGNTVSQQQLIFKLDPVTNKTGDIWHIHLSALPQNIRYGYRLSGPDDPNSGHGFNSSLTLIDPYAKELRAPDWGEDRSCLGKKCCGLIPDISYDWENDRPLHTPLQDSIIYEMHVRGFTRHPSANNSCPGTFKGLTEKIPYLRDLGITAVELMPVTEFDENESTFHNPETGEQLKNYWGYSPLSFFAPKSAYASDRSHPLNEFRDMVKSLHRAGIEVILDIVYNHTAEGGWDGPTSSFRGIDNTIYYLLDPWTREYLNFSGCGNTCNCNHPLVRSLIMDALRWWVVEMHVDGFRFDLASILGRDQQGNLLSNPPVVEIIAEDPILAKTKIIAEAWDAAGLYQVGSFSPHPRWAEWNGRFRDDVRAFMCGKPGMVPALATRISGSSDLYQHSGRRPYNSINFVTSHDGFTLADLVSYNEKHNLANGENNRDGDNNNLSWNSGVEGDTDDPEILKMRSRRIRTMAVILLLSQGVPMLAAGDEFGRSQQGNNNAWCQDNDISWINWQLAEDNNHQLQFFKKLIRLRRTHSLFRRADFFAGEHGATGSSRAREIIWQGLQPGSEDWSYTCHTLAFTLVGKESSEQTAFFVMLNGHRTQSAPFTLPSVRDSENTGNWKKIIDTSLTSPHDFVAPAQALTLKGGTQIHLAPMAAIVLQSGENL